MVICYLFKCFFSCSEVWTTSYLLLLLILIIGSICLIIIQLWGFKVWGSIDHLFERSKRCKNENFILGMCVVDQANEKLRPNLKKKKKRGCTQLPCACVQCQLAASSSKRLKALSGRDSIFPRVSVLGEAGEGPRLEPACSTLVSSCPLAPPRPPPPNPEVWARPWALGDQHFIFCL